MNSEADVIEYGSCAIPYDIFRAERSTLEIAVLPDMRVVITAPFDTSLEKIKTKALKRRSWIVKQIRYFQQFHPRTPERRYVSGETHMYLGRQYRLKVEIGEEDVRFSQSRIVVATQKEDSEHIKKQLDIWYRQKASLHFSKVIEKYMPYFAGKGFDKPQLVLRNMNTRWGSLSEHNTLTLNPRLIQAPKSSIEYVIVHELCHLEVRSHNNQFHALLEELLPDYKERKQKLELILS